MTDILSFNKLVLVVYLVLSYYQLTQSEGRISQITVTYSDQLVEMCNFDRLFLGWNLQWIFMWKCKVLCLPKPGLRSRALCGTVYTINSCSTLLKWPIVSLLILFILFSNVFVFWYMTIIYALVFNLAEHHTLSGRDLNPGPRFGNKCSPHWAKEAINILINIKYISSVSVKFGNCCAPHLFSSALNLPFLSSISIFQHPGFQQIIILLLYIPLLM